MGAKSSSGPGALVWVAAVVAIAALAFFGWRSNQARTTAAPASAPASSRQAPAPEQAPKPPPTASGGLIG